MKQYPSKLKYKKNFKIQSSVFNLLDQKNFFLKFGIFGLQALESGKLTFKQIEACRKAIRRTLNKTGDIFILVFTGFSQTKKPVGSRMGKGKGNHSIWICPVKIGQVLFEIADVSNYLAYKALINAGYKLPIKVKIIKLFY